MPDRTAFLKLARQRWKQGEDAEQAQRQREIEDLRFYAGEQWDRDILRARQGRTLGSGTNTQVVPARPTIVVNRCLEPVSQVLNQERQSDLTIELIPADDFGDQGSLIDHTEIELREGLVRRIQRDSEAADAYTWAFSRAAIAGRGYFGVMTRYAPGKTTDQEIYIHRYYNQGSVLLDPAREQPDGSDAEWGFVGTDVPWLRYIAEYPRRNGKKNRLNPNISDTEWRQLGDGEPAWFSGEGDTRFVRVVEYWYIERTTRELAMFPDGRAEWVDELPDDTDPKSYTSRSVVEKQIKWAKIDGCDDDVLEETEWDGHYIPIVQVLGEELQPYDDERRVQGIVRPMRGPCEGNNYIISKFVEQVGLTPIPPWLGPAGFDEGYENEYDAANTRALSRLHYNSKDLMGNPIPPGAVGRTPISTDVQHLAFGVQVFGQAIVSTSKVSETALGNIDPSVKSGKLARALIEQNEQGNSNFLDNLQRSMRHCARIVNDLLYPIYGTRPGRLARMMNPQGEMSAVVIGQPFTTQGTGPQARPQPLQLQPGQPTPPNAKTYKLTPDAEFNVAIKISKSEGTRRQQEVQDLGNLIQADPNLMGVLGDLFFKYQDGPGHQEMSERMKATLIPPVQAMLNGGQTPTNPQDAQKMQLMQQQIQQLSELADKNKTTLLKTKMDNDSKERQTQMELQAKERLALVQQLGALFAVDAKIDAENARTEVEAAIARVDKELNIRTQMVDHAHERLTQQADQQHEVAVTALEHAHEANMAQLGHQQALEQGQQAADLTPGPTEQPA